MGKGMSTITTVGKSSLFKNTKAWRHSALLPKSWSYSETLLPFSTNERRAFGQMCTLLYTTFTYFAVSQSVLQNRFTELRPSEITLMNRVNQSQGSKLSFTHSLTHTLTHALTHFPYVVIASLKAVRLENKKYHRFEFVTVCWVKVVCIKWTHCGCLFSPPSSVTWF